MGWWRDGEAHGFGKYFLADGTLIEKGQFEKSLRKDYRGRPNIEITPEQWKEIRTGKEDVLKDFSKVNAPNNPMNPQGISKFAQNYSHAQGTAEHALKRFAAN